MLVVHGGPTTAVVRGRTGEPVVLLSGELPEFLTPSRRLALLNLAAAVLTHEETQLFRRCLEALTYGEKLDERRIEVSGAILTIYKA